MKNTYRIMLGRKSIHAAECFANNYLATRPDKTKIAAGLACGVI